MHAIRCNPVLLGAGEHTYLNCLAFPVSLNPLVEDLSYLSLCIPANASRTGGVPTLRENLRCNILHPDPDRPPLRNLHPPSSMRISLFLLLRNNGINPLLHTDGREWD